MDNTEIAKKIIAENIYLSIATMSTKPWIASIRYQVDDDYNFFFASKKDTRHVADILQYAFTACSIFDSHQEDGTGQGIQMEGVTTLLEGDKLEDAVKKIWPDDIEGKLQNFSGESIYRLFTFHPEHVFILDPKDIAADRRIEVNL